MVSFNLHIEKQLLRRCIIRGLQLFLAALFTIPIAASATDSKGTDFWLTFPYNVPTVDLSLFIAGDSPASGEVTIQNPAFSQPFNVIPGTVTTINIPQEALLSLVDTVEDKGIHVIADAEVTVYGLNQRSASTDAYLALPSDVLGTEYLTMNYAPTIAGFDYPPNIGIVATQDNTTVTVVPTSDTTSNPAGIPFNIIMDQGQTYYIAAASFDNDLTGSVISSDKPVSVFSGAVCTQVPSGFTYCDHIVEQIPPTSAWGREFVTVPLATRLNGDTFRFLASVDGTTITINGSLAATINRGEFHEQILPDASVISASQPILVAQYSNSTEYDGVTSDPFMMLIPPYEQFLAAYTVSTPATVFTINYINIVTPDAGVGSILLDNSLIPVAEFSAIGTSGYSGAQVAVDVGSHALTGTLPFGVFSYGFADADSYGYPGGMSLSPVAIASSLELTPQTVVALIATETCLTALITDQENQPLEGVRVDFTVTGTNDITDFANTDVNGEAVFCYSSLDEGEDTVEARVGQLSDTSIVTWSAEAPTGGTYVKAKGAGAIGPWGLLIMLGGLLWLRRKSIYKNIITTLPIILIAGTMAGLAPSTSNAAEPPWYVGMSIGQSNADYSASDLTRDMSAFGYTISNVVVDDTDTAWKLFAGYRINPNLAVEASYTRLGEITSAMNTNAANMQQFIDDLTVVHQFMTNSVGVSVVGILPVNERLEVFGKLGFHFWEANTEALVVNGNIYGQINKDGEDLTWGLGAEYSVTEKWSARIEYERFEADGNWIDFVSVGAVLSF